MALIKNMEKVWKAAPGVSVTVGNNRTITRDESGAFVCRLHGHPVVTITPKGASGIAYVRLDVCGYLTTTTVAAMSDFLGAFGISAAASRAGGFLSARWKMPSGAWRDKRCNGYGVLEFTGHRYV